MKSIAPRNENPHERPVSRLFELLACLLFLAAPASPGAAGAAPAANQTPISAVDNDVIAMRALVVTATRIPERPWRYASIPGYEVLSNCDDNQTKEYMRALLRGNDINNALLPKRALRPVATPVTTILFHYIPQEGLAAAVMSKPEHVQTDGVLWGYSVPAIDTPTSMADDVDTEVYCQGLGYNAVSSFLTHSFRFLLERRAPVFPGWLIEGLSGPNGIFNQVDMDTGAPDSATVRQCTLPTAQWISDSETILVRKKSKLATPILPLEDFFAQENMVRSRRSPVWFAEAALFVRWGILGNADKEHSSPVSFWSFVNKACGGPTTERDFRDCFGFGYAEMESRLREYLPKAISGMLEFDVDVDWDPPLPSLRDATAAERGRIMGDWQRLIGVGLRRRNPSLSAEFLRVAGDTLLAPYTAGSREPRLLAVLGLYEQSIGEPGKAREFLEKAASEHVTRPSAYIALAHLRYNEARAHPLGHDGKFNSDQVASVLGPSFAASKLSPPMTETYWMIRDAWAQSEVNPTSADLAVLEEGTSLFWRDRQFAEGVAKLRTLWGLP